MNRKNRTQNSIIVLMNLTSLAFFGAIFYFYWYEVYHEIVYFYQKGNWMLLGVYVGALALFMQIYGGFKIGSSKVFDLIYSQFLALFFSVIFLYVQTSLVVKRFIPINGFFIIFLVSGIVSVVLNYLIHKIFHSIFPAKKTVILFQGGIGSLDLRLKRYQSDNFDIVESIEFTNQADIVDILDKYESIIIVGLTPMAKNIIHDHCYKKTSSLYEVPNTYDICIKNSTPFFLIDTPLFRLNNFGPSQFSKVLKRGIDILVSLVALIVTSPLFIIVSVLIKINDKGPVFYKQVRLTQHGREFEIIKFRSMKIDAEKDGIQLAKENDLRITNIGKIIRKLRIDELPQLLNILKGDMSLVGPRPERPEIANEIYTELPEFENRLKVKAGLTGYAQVYGKYNTSLSDKLLFDMMYIEGYSLLLDLKIIMITIKILFIKDSTEGVAE